MAETHCYCQKKYRKKKEKIHQNWFRLDWQYHSHRALDLWAHVVRNITKSLPSWLQLPFVALFRSLLMGQFKVTAMNWAPLYVSLAALATIWFLQVRHLELVSLMAKGEENGHNKTLFADVSSFHAFIKHFGISSHKVSNLKYGMRRKGRVYGA